MMMVPLPTGSTTGSTNARHGTPPKSRSLMAESWFSNFFSPPSGSATGFPNGPHPKGQFLAVVMKVSVFKNPNALIGEFEEEDLHSIRPITGYEYCMCCI